MAAAWGPLSASPSASPSAFPDPEAGAPDWAAAYAEMDATRAAAATTRAEAGAGSGLAKPSDSSSRSGKQKTDWEAAYRDIEATRAAARASGSREASDNRRAGDAADAALARDLMDKLAAIGSEGADALFAQSPEARRREEA